MFKKLILVLITIIISLLVIGCSKSTGGNVELVGINKTESGNIFLQSIPNDFIKIELDGYSSNIIKDKDNRFWIPLEYTKQIPEANDTVLIIKNNEIIHKISNLPYYPIKVIEGTKNINAILCSVDGTEGKVVFINNENFEVIKTIKIKGNITDGVFDDKHFYVTSDDLENLGNSFIHKIEMNDYEVNSTNLNGKYSPSLFEHGENIYILLGMLEKPTDHSYIVMLNKENLNIKKTYDVLPSPYRVIKYKDNVYILHISLTSNFGGKITVMDLKSESLKVINSNIYANEMVLLKDEIIFFSTITKEFGTLDLSSLKFKKDSKLTKDFISNLIKY
jgi:hypothetical protein